MNSSISNSEPVVVVAPRGPKPAPRRRAWTRPLALVAGVLLLLELLTRLVLLPASRDLRSSAGFGAAARALFAEPGPHVVVVGNSATGQGIDPGLLGLRLGARAGVFAADSAKITTMYWIVQHDFWSQGLAPPLVVLPWFDNQLADGEEIDVGRLARYFSGPRDWPELFRYDLRGLDQRAELVVSAISAAFAARKRVKERVLDLVPYYQDSIGMANRVLYDHEHAPGSEHATYDTLRRFIRRARAHGTRLCFVAFPSRNGTQITPEAARLIADGGMRIIDLRRVDGLTAQHYKDFVHLNASGRAHFTRALAEAIGDLAY